MKQILILMRSFLSAPSVIDLARGPSIGDLIDSMVAHEFDMYLIFGRRSLRFHHVRMRRMTSTGHRADGIFLKVDGESCMMSYLSFIICEN